VNVNDDAKELYNMPEGAFVYSVNEGSAAEAAGIRKGDIITKFDGETVSSSDDLIDKISYYQAGETVTLEIQTVNDGEYTVREVEVTLQEGSSDAGDTSDDADSTDNDQQEGGSDSADGQLEEEYEIPGGSSEFQQLPFGFGGNGTY
jgi:serine protease Do